MSAARPVINLLSDTVTQPTLAMREVIATAVVGDDVFGADPSVNDLQQYAAELLGKEAALFVPSGTMANLIAVGAHCRRGDEIILGDKAHIVTYEGGGASAYMGVSFRTVPNQTDGTLRLEDLKDAIRGDDPHYPRSRLVALENTQNNCGGRVLSVEYTNQVAAFCKEHNLRLHIDGARLANASVALGVPLAELVRGADSVSLCLSKGLGAPVGSILAGTKDFIYHAKRLRKSLGGGMRQVGIIAAPAKFALEHQFDRLADDHANAKLLAQGLSQIPGIRLNVDEIDTNIVFFNLTTEAKLNALGLVTKLKEEKGILVGGGYWAGERVRAVTNLHITKEDVEYTIQSIRELLA
ncbi:hypothetical protein Poli38472_008554 [Pythium oligandrum]|uniref:Aromatic amino acid beta-eliminating lyase/threonine aldolase domain-containing protein n=1 Tax=Pythium oligandrum TaxID=41045 RepID=A0A8K1FBA4_PYTOL|nr:hypothetical protein Poli38472_008554 [Pythium oligandrum]|eukprot:TMW55906.1 hypothetical protein Poli38472_008554 [Pythium oligandrum]